MKRYFLFALGVVLIIGLAYCFDSTFDFTFTSVNTETKEIIVHEGDAASIEGKVLFKTFGIDRDDEGAKIYLVSLTKANPKLTAKDKFRNVTYSTIVNDEGSFKFSNLPTDCYLLIIHSDHVSYASMIQDRISADINPKVTPLLYNKDQLDSILGKNATLAKEIDVSQGNRMIITHDFGPSK